MSLKCRTPRRGDGGENGTHGTSLTWSIQMVPGLQSGALTLPALEFGPEPETGTPTTAAPESRRSSRRGRFNSLRDTFRVSVRCGCPSSSADVVVDPVEPRLATVGVEMLSSVAIGVDVTGACIWRHS